MTHKILLKRPGTRSRRDGFTLIELLIVLVILGLLAGLAAPRVIRFLSGAKTDVARLQIASLGASLDLYVLDAGGYPSTQEGLTVLVEAPAGAENWNGPYTKASTLPLDPWGNDYIYEYPGEGKPYNLSSLGADNAEGGEDEDQDVTNQ